ncbi:MAG: TIGR02221 family CRISPR-associated protein [Chloroflexi bacterium CFX4]|nr:TIGR02221 family CRISPR-associated protein [Chloroflexi bacterium CFX4]MDL1924234.1 TIGR02221 family CRISPR-associated protein [Chloroflexi bacterium CFX3]
MTQETTPHVLVTMIGAGKPGEISYHEIEYHFEFASPKRGKFFSVLLCDALKEKDAQNAIQKAFVLLTPKAKEHANWLGTEQEGGLRKLLEESGIEVIPVDIPNGNTEQEFWDIFDAIGDNIPHNTTVMLDITHGFRSIPLVMLLACAYFGTSGNFKLASAYYGAFEPGNPTAYAVELTPMLTLFEWANAVKVFKDGSDLRPMAALLQERHETLYKTGTVKGVTLVLRPLGNQMQKLTDALELGRLESIAEPVQEARRLVREVEETAERWVKPFVSQINAILKELDHFQMPTDEKDVSGRLLAEFGLIEWYAEKGYHMQAGLLLVEWITSYVAKHDPEFEGQNIFTDKGKREALSAKIHRLRAEVLRLKEESGGSLDFTMRLGGIADFHDIWNELSELRNDLAHFGHRAGSLTTSNIPGKIGKLIGRVRPLLETLKKAD